MKKILSMMLVLTLIFVAVGCNNDAPAADEPPADTPSDEPADTPADTPSLDVEEKAFNLGMDSPEDTVTYLFAQKFGELLNAKSGGAYTVNLFANGQLGNDRELVESMQSGEVDFVVQTTAPQVNFVPELAVFDMANVFPDAETARKVLDGEFFDQIAPFYVDRNLKLLAYADQSFRELTTNTAVNELSDLAGQKIRTMENPYHIAYWTALGANPTPMAWGEVYIGLQQGTIDGQENPYEVIVSSKMYEQQDYVVNTNHILHILALTSSKATFDGLPAEAQAWVQEAADEAKVYAREQADARIAERVQIIKDSGTEIIDLSPELLAEMQEKAQAQYDEIRAAIGAELVDGLLEATEQAK